MLKIPAIFFMFPFFILPQIDNINFHSPENRKKFADDLFCEGDYLRAVEEYESIHEVIKNDTVERLVVACENGLISKADAKKEIKLQEIFASSITEEEQPQKEIEEITTQEALNEGNWK